MNIGQGQCGEHWTRTVWWTLDKDNVVNIGQGQCGEHWTRTVWWTLDKDSLLKWTRAVWWTFYTFGLCFLSFEKSWLSIILLRINQFAAFQLFLLSYSRDTFFFSYSVTLKKFRNKVNVFIRLQLVDYSLESCRKVRPVYSNLKIVLGAECWVLGVLTGGEAGAYYGL